MIDCRQMTLFVAVAEELHFGRAAQRVGMAQPSFSQQIRRIERALDVTLLDRTSRSVALTSAGAVLLEEARDLLARRDRTIDAVQRTARGDAGILRIGFAASSAVGLLAAIIGDVGRDLPGIEVRIDDRDGVDVAAAIRAGALDVAIVRAPFAAAGLAARTLHRDTFVAIVPASHPLAAAAGIAVADLAPEPFVLFPRATSPGLHDTIIGLCTRAGFSPVIAQQATAWLSVIGLVESGLGVTIAPAMAARACPAGVRVVPLIDARAHADLMLVHSAGPANPLVKRFAAVARSSCRDREGRWPPVTTD